MDKMCVSFLGVLLLALLLSSQVTEAANDTATNSTATNSTTSGTNATVTPVPTVNATKDKNGAERAGSVALLLLPLALGASLLHSCS